MPPNAPDHDYIVLGGQRLELRKHPTDFSVIGDSALSSLPRVRGSRPLSRSATRIETATEAERDQLMEEARSDGVAHHIYQVADTGEEIVIDDHILLSLEREDPEVLKRIVSELHLVAEGRLGDAHVLRLTKETGRNPLKVANELAERAGVTASQPRVLLDHQLHGSRERRPR